jgi:hypothetical protein
MLLKVEFFTAYVQGYFVFALMIFFLYYQFGLGANL